MIDRHLVDTCSRITAIQNVYGDYVESATVTVQCRWRDIVGDRIDSRGHYHGTDAMVWFATSEPAAQGSIYQRGGLYYQIERVTKARRLGSTEVNFVKAEMRITHIS